MPVIFVKKNFSLDSLTKDFEIHFWFSKVSETSQNLLFLNFGRILLNSSVDNFLGILGKLQINFFSKNSLGGYFKVKSGT